MSTYPYSFKLKLKAVRLYRQGCSPTTIAKELGVKCSSTIVCWARLYKKIGADGLKVKKNTHLCASESEVVVRDFLTNHLTLEDASIKYGICDSCIRKWVKTVMEQGYDGLYTKEIQKNLKEMGRKKKSEPKTELERLQYENEWLRTENAMLKKARALMIEMELQKRKSGPGSSNH